MLKHNLRVEPVIPGRAAHALEIVGIGRPCPLYKGNRADTEHIDGDVDQSLNKSEIPQNVVDMDVEVRVPLGQHEPRNRDGKKERKKNGIPFPCYVLHRGFATNPNHAKTEQPREQLSRQPSHQRRAPREDIRLDNGERVAFQRRLKVRPKMRRIAVSAAFDVLFENALQTLANGIAPNLRCRATGGLTS